MTINESRINLEFTDFVLITEENKISEAGYFDNGYEV